MLLIGLCFPKSWPNSFFKKITLLWCSLCHLTAIYGLKSCLVNIKDILVSLCLSFHVSLNFSHHSFPAFTPAFIWSFLSDGNGASSPPRDVPPLKSFCHQSSYTLSIPASLLHQRFCVHSLLTASFLSLPFLSGPLVLLCILLAGQPPCLLCSSKPVAESSRLQRSLSESKVNGWLFEHILEVGGGRERWGCGGWESSRDIVCFSVLRTMFTILMPPFLTLLLFPLLNV